MVEIWASKSLVPTKHVFLEESKYCFTIPFSIVLKETHVHGPFVEVGSYGHHPVNLLSLSSLSVAIIPSQ
jgi:hypothetical protein